MEAISPAANYTIFLFTSTYWMKNEQLVRQVSPGTACMDHLFSPSIFKCCCVNRPLIHNALTNRFIAHANCYLEIRLSDITTVKPELCNGVNHPACTESEQ